MAFCKEQELEFSSVLANEAQMDNVIAQLSRNLTLLQGHLPYWSRESWEYSCFSLAFWEGFRLDFHERIDFQTQDRVIDITNNRSGRFRGLNVTVFTKRQVLRRVRNEQETAVSAGSEKSKVTIDSTTDGWSMGAQLTAGHFQPMGLLFAQTGVTVSSTYSNHTTTGTQYSVVERNNFNCLPGYYCRSEAWTSYVKLSGPCVGRPKVVCNSEVLYPCEYRTPESWQKKVPRRWQCPQMTTYWKKACFPARYCEVVTPIVDEEGKPIVTEVFSSHPIPNFHPKPQITEYKAGVFTLGSDNYIYDPSRQRDKYWNKDLGWHQNKAYPDLDDDVAKFVHKRPTLLKFRDGCYELKSIEWYCPSYDEETRYLAAAEVGGVIKSPYGKPTAPAPTVEDMASCLEATAAKVSTGTDDKVTISELVEEHLRLYGTLGKLQTNTQTQLAWAVANNHASMVTFLLLSSNVDPNAKDAAGRTALSRAVGNGNIDMTKLLLTSPRVSITIPDKKGRTPLFWAAAKGRTEVAELLLAAEAEPTAADNKGRTPLLVAAVNGHEDVVALLLGLKTVDANMGDSEGRTPLWWAHRKGHADVVELLSSRRDLAGRHDDAGNLTGSR
ncbi:hypothetical protein GQ602_006364 [Ophiocordyceps camponoti-floridani]|uniref:Uncharacterized protein n=1 Tax=Ophiocordyceps camponoti-floridani TaxID=2030778 RepID=A0A8H4Q337_9HYPO|nr:hypothetical protein GQ602_006364 [Ophiocordyceps camponoti-floridani]